MNLLPALTVHPTAALLSAVAALAYAVLAWASARLSPAQTRALLAIAWLLHLLVLSVKLLDHPAHFGFAPALSVTAWLVFTVYLIESRMFPQMPARWPLAVLGALAIVLALVFPGNMHPALRSPWLQLHWALGIASYGLIGVAVVHAWMMQHAEKAMRLGEASESSIPLLTLERLTFRFVGAGFVLLSATLLAGTWFTEQYWVTMGLLLWGRWRLGWRGRTAARTLYIGAGFLLLGYVGSRFVIEVLLGNR
jgi:ABC-type uncharacterized transport system permease subunit